MQQPVSVRRQTQNGRLAPIYAYAANNPENFIDRNGRIVEVDISDQGARIQRALDLLLTTACGRRVFQELQTSPVIFHIASGDLGLTSKGEYRAGNTSPDGARCEDGLFSRVNVTLDFFNIGLGEWSHEPGVNDIQVLAHELSHAEAFTDPAILQMAEQDHDLEEAIATKFATECAGTLQ